MQKNILICPLEWGLGHAGRMIPLAKKLRELKNNIFIAAGEEYLEMFRKETEGLTFINFPGFSPVYSRFLPQYLVLFLQIPLLLFYILRDNHRLKSIIASYNIDILISDNRFGLWNKKVKTVYITHMPVIPFPRYLRFLEIIGIRLHRFIIKKYSLCYIPDLPGELNISGRLSHGCVLPANVRYIGILSRFIDCGSKDPSKAETSPYNTVILSGPEPQREIFKQKLIQILKDTETATVILEGKPLKQAKVTGSGNIISYNHLPASAMKDIIKSSGQIFCRAGYTTIMELISLNCTALLVPTPGQTEQEYLASYLSSKGWFDTVSQSKLTDRVTVSGNKIVQNDEIIGQSRVLLSDALYELLKD